MKRGALLVGLALLGLGGCPKAPSEDSRKDPPAIVDHLEIRVSAPGFSAASVEQMVVVPIEFALIGNSDIRGMISETRAGEARIELSLAGRAERVAVDVLQRMQEIQPQLPEAVDLPLLLPRDPGATTIHVELPDEGEAPRVIEALRRTVGVAEVRRCGSEQGITIELDPDALARFGVEASEVEQALRSDFQPATTVEALTKLVVKRGEWGELRLGDLASVHTEARPGGCRAYSERGPSTALAITLQHADAREAVEAHLAETRVDVRRFAARLHVWVLPGLELERALAGLGGRLGSAWLLELGVEARPCAGPGTLARLHVDEGVDLDSLASTLAGIPGVSLVERPEAPADRRWLVGPDLELLRRLGGDVVTGGELEPERVVEIDRQRLAAAGIDHGAAMAAIRMALDGVELGWLELASERQAVTLKLVSADVGAIRLGGVSLSSVGELRTESVPSRICRRDRERGVVVLGSSSVAELPAGYRWIDNR